MRPFRTLAAARSEAARYCKDLPPHGPSVRGSFYPALCGGKEAC